MSKVFLNVSNRLQTLTFVNVKFHCNKGNEKRRTWQISSKCNRTATYNSHVPYLNYLQLR
jgi:hypothetical protein